MTISLDRLPFDILFNVASYLQFDDTVHLSYTCRQLKLLLEESTLCRKTIEAYARYSKEAKLAQNYHITYGEAIKSVYDRRNAFSNAYPFSACTIGQGSAFLYRQGVLCILHNNVIQVSDSHSSSESFDIELDEITSPFLMSGSSSEAKYTLLYYSDGVIAVHFEQDGMLSNGLILAISTERGASGSANLIKPIELQSSSKLFVRHTGSILYYGTYTGTGNNGHHEWEIRGESLIPGFELPSWIKPLQLEDFYGTDIGSTIAFEIHDGYFYALSNQTSFEVEELDWTSFYNCVRFPLDHPVPDLLQINSRIYRRQHAEGPIHDSWTDLTIQVDERTNQPVIVESRREWQRSSSRQFRTFYATKIEFPLKSRSSEDDSLGIGASDLAMLPADDPFTHLVDSTNKPSYAPWQPRFAWNFHPEFGPECVAPRSFILARTKFRAYNYSCSSFIDLVEDERCCADPSADPCLRIRIGSRRVAPLGWAPFDSASSSKGKSTAVRLPAPDDDVLYRHSKIRMWPPPASNCPCSKRLHDILNPKVGSGLGNRTITGVADDRSLVYMVKAGRSYAQDDNALGTIVLVNFHRNARRPPLAVPYLKANTSCQNEQIDDHVSASQWHWSPGHSSRCRKVEC